MSNLLSSVPSAVNALYELISTAGGQQTPPVEVFHTAVFANEPASYVCLGPTPSGRPMVEEHRYEWAAIGVGQFPQYEMYSICGYASAYIGDAAGTATTVNGPEPTTRLAMEAAYSLYQSVVMDPFLTAYGNGTPVLGDTLVQLMWCLPGEAAYFPGSPVSGGFFGNVEFCFNLRARLTIA